jgi:chromosome segregation ATPase
MSERDTEQALYNIERAQELCEDRIWLVEMERDAANGALSALVKMFAALGRDNDELRARVVELLQANNEFEERARKAERELRAAHVYAEALAEVLHDKHFRFDSPCWRPLPDLLGLLTQIDNMTSGLARPVPPIPDADEE